MPFSPLITMDVEGWAQSTLDPNIPIPTIAEKDMDYVLDLFSQLNVKATMFVLGKYAKKFPESVKRIQASGHEIASHGFGHINAFEQSSKEFRTDIVDAKNRLEDLTGIEVNGYRAPAFSILNNNLWALNEIAEAGYTFDSSIYPIEHSRYGIKEFPKHSVELKLENGMTLYEYPISAYKRNDKYYPVGGGGYHRLLPGFMIRFVAKKILMTRDFVYYCHPYEFNGLTSFSTELQTLNLDISLYTKIHQGLGRGKIFEGRFKGFVREFPPRETIIENIQRRRTGMDTVHIRDLINQTREVA